MAGDAHRGVDHVPRGVVVGAEDPASPRQRRKPPRKAFDAKRGILVPLAVEHAALDAGLGAQRLERGEPREIPLRKAGARHGGQAGRHAGGEFAEGHARDGRVVAHDGGGAEPLGGVLRIEVHDGHPPEQGEGKELVPRGPLHDAADGAVPREERPHPGGAGLGRRDGDGLPALRPREAPDAGELAPASLLLGMEVEEENGVPVHDGNSFRSPGDEPRRRSSMRRRRAARSRGAFTRPSSVARWRRTRRRTNA